MIQETSLVVKEQSNLIRALQNKPQPTKRGGQKEIGQERNSLEMDRFIEMYKQTISGVCTELNECKLTVQQLKDAPRIRPKRRTLTVRGNVDTVRPEQFDNFDTKRVVFHSGVVKIADDAFSNWKYLKHLIF